jgi:hypothetical protein
MSDVYVKSRTPKEDGTLVADLHECMRHSTPEGRVWAQTVLNLLRDLEAGGERQRAARWRLDDIRITLMAASCYGPITEVGCSYFGEAIRERVRPYLMTTFRERIRVAHSWWERLRRRAA